MNEIVYLNGLTESLAMARKTVVTIEHVWNDKPDPYNKDISVLPYIDGVCRLENFELFYGRYANSSGFNGWLERFASILQERERRIVLYLAGHGSYKTLGGKNINSLLEKVWISANALNIEGMILGGCFVGKNINEIKRWMTGSQLTWVIGYKYAVDWLPSMFFDMNIIKSALASRQDALEDRVKLEGAMRVGASLFHPNTEISTDIKGFRYPFNETVTSVIQPRRQGQIPVEIDIF